MSQIRSAQIDDLDAIARLYAQLHPGDPSVFDGAGPETFAQIIERPGVEILVLEVGGDVVATTYLNVIPNLTRASRPYAVIENVVVDERLRGTGIGKQIMAATLQRAWDADCYKVMLMTGSTRPSTLGFYEACGFDPDAKSAFLAKPPTP